MGKRAVHILVTGDLVDSIRTSQERMPSERCTSQTVVFAESDYERGY